MSFLLSLIKPVIYISVPVVILRSMSPPYSKTRYYVNLGVYFSCMSAVATCAAFVAASMCAFGQKYNVNYVIARTFYYVAGTALDIKVEIEGEEYLDTRPAVLISNHQTAVDILFVGRLMPKNCSMMAKESLKFSPVGPFMLMSGALFIDRKNNVKAVESLKKAGQEMKEKQLSLWMFPEGTRHSGESPSLLPFKKGGFHLAIQAGIPIVPIVIENYWHIYHKGVFEGRQHMKVRVLPPIPTTGLTATDASDLAVRVREQMLTVLRDISVKVPGAVMEVPPPAPQVIPEPTVTVSTPEIARTTSRESLASSIGVVGRKSEPSENGTETEEDEGMVIVGRPA